MPLIELVPPSTLPRGRYIVRLFSCLLGRAVEHPVDARIGERLGVADGDVDPRVAVLDAGFQQQHAVASGFRKAAGDGAARRTGAGDDEVEFVVVGHRSRSVPLYTSPACGRGRREAARVRVSQHASTLTRRFAPTSPASGRGVRDYAVAASFTPSSAAIRSRMMNFCILPVTVIGNSSTNRICRGTL